MKLLIDIGNTTAKLAVMDNDIIHFERRHQPWKDTLTRILATYPITHVRLSTVAGEDLELNDALSTLNCPVLTLTASTPCPVKPITNIPSTYGADRWAADIGAIQQDSCHTLLVIDAGTCITYDLISAQGRLLGGAISPGVQLRLNAMHQHTHLLPQIQAQPHAPLLGHDTSTCMLSAAINGARFEMEGYICNLWKEYPDLHVFITGGTTFKIADDITIPITHDPYLVFRGLNAL